MASSGTGIAGIVLEGVNTSGVVPLMPDTAFASSITAGITPISTTYPMTGNRVEIVGKGVTSTGTFTVVGTDMANNAATETTPTVPVANPNAQSPEVGAFKYLTQKVFKTITSLTCSSGLLTGGGLARLAGVSVEKYLLPCTFKYTDKKGAYSPNLLTGIPARHQNRQQLMNEVDWEISHPLFPDTCLYNPYMLFGAPTSVVTIPASPDVLLAATSVSGSMTLTTQPKAPAEKLILTVAGTSTPGTIVVTGTNKNGQTVTDSLAPSTAGVFYTGNAYKTVTSIATTGLTGGTLAVGGVFGWQLKFDDVTNYDSWYSAMLAIYNGVDTRAFPFCYAEEADYEFGMNKEFTITTKGKAQDSLPIGDRTTSPMSGSRLSTLAQNSDMPIMGWQTMAWTDAQYVTPQTTPNNTVTECKISVKTPRETVKTIANTQRFYDANNKKDGREFSFELKVDYRDLSQFEIFRKNLKQILSVGAFGQTLGFVGSTLYSEAWYFTMPYKYDADGIEPETDVSKSNVEATLKGVAEYAPELGYSLQMTLITSTPPTYPS